MAAVACAVALIQPSAAGPVAAIPHRDVQQQPGRSGADATIRLIEQNAVVAPDGDFTAFLEVDGAPEGSDLAIDIYPVIDDEELLEEALDGDLSNSQATFPVVTLPPASGDRPVQTGFVINLYPRGEGSPGGGWAKRLDEPGVYPVRVRLRGPDTETLATLVTFLVRDAEADDDLDPATVALVPQLRTDTSPEEALDGAGTALGAEDLNSIATLVETFAAHPDVPASFSVPADVARRLQASGSGGGGGATEPAAPSGEPGSGEPGAGEPGTGGGTGTTGGTSPGSGSTSTTAAGQPPEEASDVVEQLRAVLAGDHRELLAATFVDVDPTELVAAGLEDELSRQHDLGFRDLADVLEPPVGDTWPVRRPLDPDTVDALTAMGVTNLLVPPRSVSGEAPPLPARIDRTSGGARATVLDPGLTTGGNTDAVLAAQRLLGRTIARSMIEGGAPQLVSVPLPESVEDVAELDAFLTLLTEWGSRVEATTVTDLIRSSTTEPDEVSLTSPDLDPTGSFPEDLTATRSLVDAYASMIPDRPDLAAQVGEQLSRSAAAGLSRERRASVVGGVRDLVESRFAQVDMPASDRVTLGARDAQFPLVISSESEVPLRVIVELSSASDRLTVEQERIEVVLDSDRTVVPVRVHSRSPGDTPINITVTTLDGQVILSEGTYSVRSTAVSGVGLLLTVGAGLFLALWWGRHFLRARRSRARHAR